MMRLKVKSHRIIATEIKTRHLTNLLRYACVWKLFSALDLRLRLLLRYSHILKLLLSWLQTNRELIRK